MSVLQYRTKSGATVRLSVLLGQGGEGTVSSVEGPGELAAKIYKAGLAAGRESKVLAMVDARLHATNQFVAYPLDALFDMQSGTFAGFTMRKASNRKEVHELYSPSSRKTAFPSATFPLLVRAMANVARAMASVHASGCVVGDVNHSVVMVASDATITLIDSDSFQFQAAGRVFPCKVGTPDFTPPELQGQSFEGVLRTANHDAFGLATLVFMTLFMGRFPFVGRFKGAGDMPDIERSIREYRFAYSNRRAATQMEPPPHVPTLADLPLPLADAFERAFGPLGVSPSGRPTASDWVGLLDRAEADLVKCNQRASHHHFRQATGCPWCRMERGFPGFVAFVPTVSASTPGGAPIDLRQLIAAIRGIPDPGPAPDLAKLMPALPDLAPSPATKGAGRSRVGRRFAGVVSGFAGVGLFSLGGGGALFGIIALIVAFGLMFSPPEIVGTLSKAAKASQAEWETAKRQFEQSAGNATFLKARQDAETLIQQVQNLPGEEARRITALDAKRRDLQMQRHLERFKITQAKVSGVGEARKLTLRSYGIETAADLDYNKIVAIRGFGPATANNLIKWRRTAEAKFAFDPSRPIDPQDIAVVKADVTKIRADLVQRLRQITAELEKYALEAKAYRTSNSSQYIAVWTAHRQAEVDLEALNFS